MRSFLFRGIAAAAGMLALAACQQSVPDSAAREIQLEGGVRVPQTILPPEEQVIVQVPGAGQPMPAPGSLSDAETLAAQTRAALGAPAAPVGTDLASLDPVPVGPPAPLPVPVESRLSNAPPAGTPPQPRGTPGISSEQDFSAVTAERSIEEDAERLRQLRAQGGVTPVTPDEVVLERPSGGAPNVVAYALQQARPVGNPGFARGAFASQRSAARKCQAYRNADAAQAAFLERGGPQQDRLGLDPDGDGNACSWDPAAYRSIVQNR